MPSMTRRPAEEAAALRAACADDPDAMFPTRESERPGHHTAGELAALAVCHRCPVLGTCRATVLDTLDTAPLPYGVAGGLTREDRRQARVARRGQHATPTVEAHARPVHPQGEAGSSARLVAPAPWREPAAVVDELDAAIAAVLAVHPQVAGVIDEVTVRGLVLGHPVGEASRWAVAIAAVVMLARGAAKARITRVLGEAPNQLTRWATRHAAGTPLIPGAPGTGRALPRPTTSTAVPGTAAPGRAA